MGSCSRLFCLAQFQEMVIIPKIHTFDMEPGSQGGSGVLNTWASSHDPRHKMIFESMKSRCIMILGMLSWSLATIKEHRS